MSINYETIKRGFISKEQAIAIADSRMKDSIFLNGKKVHCYYGWILFKKFDIVLVQFNSNFAWHVKVKAGEWGAYIPKKIFVYYLSWYSC